MIKAMKNLWNVYKCNTGFVIIVCFLPVAIEFKALFFIYIRPNGSKNGKWASWHGDSDAK